MIIIVLYLLFRDGQIKFRPYNYADRVSIGQCYREYDCEWTRQQQQQCVSETKQVYLFGKIANIFC